jgi:hypothetical protein
MTMYARIEHKAEGIYTASLIAWPDIVAQGPSEDEAIRSLREVVTTRLAGSKVVPFDIGVERSWLQTAGMFRGHPFADELDAVMADYRRERDGVEQDSPSQDHAA